MPRTFYLALESETPRPVLPLELIGIRAEPWPAGAYIVYLFLRALSTSGDFQERSIYQFRFAAQEPTLDAIQFPTADSYPIETTSTRIDAGDFEAWLHHSQPGRLARGGLLFSSRAQADEYATS